MCNVKGSAALVIAAAAMIMFLTGCETTKHAEVMSAEELAAKAQASASQGTGSDGDQGGIPLAGQGMSEGSLSVGDSSGTAAGTGSSEGPLSPTLRDVSGASERTRSYDQLKHDYRSTPHQTLRNPHGH